MSVLPPRRPDDIVLAAGVRTPFSRFGGALRYVPSVELGADIGGRPVMVDVGEVALAWDVSRGMQDDWAEASHQRCFEAKAAGFHAGHLVPVDLPAWKAQLDQDEMPCADCSRAKLATLPTVYDSATITAGNRGQLAKMNPRGGALGEGDAVALIVD